MRDRIRTVVALIGRYLDIIETQRNHRVVAEIRGLLNELLNL